MDCGVNTSSSLLVGHTHDQNPATVPVEPFSEECGFTQQFHSLPLSYNKKRIKLEIEKLETNSKALVCACMLNKLTKCL